MWMVLPLLLLLLQGGVSVPLSSIRGSFRLVVPIATFVTGVFSVGTISSPHHRKLIHFYYSHSGNKNEPPKGERTTGTTGIPNHVIVHFDEFKLQEAASSSNSTTNIGDLLQQRAVEVANSMGGRILYVYQHAFYGVAIAIESTNVSAFEDPFTTPTHGRKKNEAKSPQEACAHHYRCRYLDIVLNRDDVTFVQQDYRVYIDQETVVDDYDSDSSFRTINETSTESGQTVPSLSPPPLGLDRIDQTSLPLDGIYNQRYDGTGVTVFVLDTGLRLTHTEFAAMAVPPTCGFDAYRRRDQGDKADSLPCEDDHNHGTHVAGIIGGRVSGVAKNVTIVAVKVIHKWGFGSDAAVYAGIDYVVGRKKASPNSPMVANLSLSGLVSWQYNRLIRKMVRAGVVVITAAGNKRIPACLASPASASQRRNAAVTVGASTYSERFQRDRRASFSNFGACVDLFAPGTLIPSASARDDTSLLRKSGTSFAAPHVAGTAALYLQKDSTLTPSQVRAHLLEDSTKGQLMRIFQRRSPNRLLYTGNI